MVIDMDSYFGDGIVPYLRYNTSPEENDKIQFCDCITIQNAMYSDGN